MMNQSSERLERKRLHTIAREYEHKGYRVIRQPGTADLPDFLSQFRPDMVAYGRDENVVVEVKSKPTLPESDYLTALAEAVDSRPGWRLELVVTNSDCTVMDGSSEELGDVGIRERIGDVRRLLGLGQDDAAALLAWSAAEATMRLLAEREGIKVERARPALMMKQLLSLGVLGREDYDLLREVFHLRNVIVHGYRSPRHNAYAVDRLASKAEDWLVTAAAHPAKERRTI